MIRSILLILSLIYGLGETQAQTSDKSNTLLWEISGNGLSKPSYIFGTYHFADKGFVDTMKTVNNKLNAADAIVGELIIDQTMAMKLMPFMMLKGTTLTQLFEKDEYKKVADYLKKETNFDLKNFDLFKPMAVQMIIIQSNLPKTFTNTNPAIDQYFQDYGKLQKKPVFELETLAEQAEVLFGGDLNRQKELLLKSVEQGEKEKKRGQKIYQLYVKQNLKKLEKFFSTETDLTQQEMDKLLADRNAKWIEKLPSLMKNQSLFIAVGAAHLIGKDGLITGLRAKGYIVEPIATN